MEEHFYCEPCDYDTNRKGNYERHMKATSHRNKVKEAEDKKNNKIIIKQWKCDMCDKVYTQRPNLYRHKKDAHSTNQNDDVGIKQNIVDQSTNTINKEITDVQNAKFQLELEWKNLEIAKKNLEIEYKTREIQIQQKIIESKEKDIVFLKNNTKQTNTIALKANDVAMKANDNLNKSLSAMSFLKKYFTKTPPLSGFTEFDKITNNSKKDIANLCLDYYKSNYYHLHAHIGDIIIKKYKTSDPEMQSIWSTDPTRNNYAVRNRIDIGDNIHKDIWNNDKNGDISASIIIDPILNKIQKEINEFIEEKMEIFNDDDTELDDKVKLQKIIYSAHDLLREIDCKELREKILTYTAPKLFLNNKIMEEFIEKQKTKTSK